jgi:dihydrofolate synthase/folylpolyglutamate synthase
MSRIAPVRRPPSSSTTAYREAEEFLLSLVNYEVLPAPARGDQEGWHLGEFTRFLADLGNPQSCYPVVHVAGTKGKGSTTRLISSILTALGWRRVGSFTSPHIESFRERIAVDNAPISEAEFVEALGAVRPACPERPHEGFRTTFEALTAMALHHFRGRGCEAAVLETGLGGRLDCTNAVSARVAVLTAIGFDHQRVLGRTLREIAYEKAGIIKPGTAVAVVGPQLPRRAAVVMREASRQASAAGVPLETFETTRDPIVRAEPLPFGWIVDLRTEAGEAAGVRLEALGRHQLDNLRTALLAVDAFARLEGRSLSVGGIRKGVEAFRAPGRMEVLRQEPAVIADSAHCPLSARAAIDACAEHFPGCRVMLVLGLLGDKNHRLILESLRRGGRIDAVFTHTPSSPRAHTGEALAALARRHFENVVSCKDVGEALWRAMRGQRRTPSAVVLATGTTYSVAEARMVFAEARTVFAEARGVLRGSVEKVRETGAGCV